MVAAVPIHAEDHLGLAYAVADTFRYRAASHGLEAEDLYQEAVVALIAAGDSFDASRQCQFSTHAFPRIRWHLLAILKRWPPLLPLPKDADGVTLDVPDRAAGESAGAAEEEVHRLLKCLPHRLWTVVAMRYGLLDGGERSAAEIGRQLGIGRQRVHQILAKAMGKLRRQAGAPSAAPMPSVAERELLAV